MSPFGVWILMSILITDAWSESTSEARLGPVFTTEPASVVQYARAIGARVACTAIAAGPAPTITWLADDGSTLSDLPGVRRTYANGTLEIVPSSGTTGDVPTTVRCRASNAHGTLLSRDVHLMPVSDGAWEVSVETGSTSVGGVAALKCRVSGAPARVALWYRADTLLEVDSPSPDSRYLSAGNTLLIRDVSSADAGAYSCVARHELTALTRRSRPAPLEVMPSSAVAGSAPRVTAASDISVQPGTPFCLPCAASQYPPPHYTWYRESEGRLQPVEGGDVWRWADGAAMCVKRAVRHHAGVWLCKAYNVFGDATAQTRLDVHHDLTVDLQPRVLVAEVGGVARLRCTSSSTVAALHWLHDGVALASRGPDLELRGLTRGQRGTYQCVAREGLRSAQAAAEIRLGESPPELLYTFIEQALRGGAAVTLRCAAAASPPPRLQWLLDDQPLDRFLARQRYLVHEETSISGETVSVLNISATQTSDGGRYSCRASNPLGSVTHSARLNIYGPPAVRALEPVKAVAGDNLTLLCPFSGYPISSVRWSRRGAATGLEGAGGRVWARAAALKLSPAMAQDAGHYTCTVTAPPAPPAARDIEIQVRNPPKISPFMFSPELTEGATVQVLCGVSSGDKPLYFSWFKDNQPLPSNLQIEEKSLNEFSLLMFPELRAAHSGRYTCRVANRAAAANYTAILTVKVAPSWETEPLDTAVLLGASLKLECVARGFPAPVVAWYKKIEGASSVDGTERWEATAPGWDVGERRSDQPSNSVRATLTARTALRSHQGLYRCSAENGVGPPLLKQINITVHEPANFGTSSDVSRNTSAVLGQSATLSCLAHGDPPLTVHWTHRGHRLDLDNYRWRVTETRTAEGTRSALRLRSAERTDAGEYRCVARNAHGRADLLLYLHVHEPPEAPRSLQLVGLGGTWVKLSWQARSPPGTRFTAFVSSLDTSALVPDQYNLTVQRDEQSEMMNTGRDKLHAKLEMLRAAHGYTLRLAAHNHVGTSPLSDPLRFTTLEEAPGGAPQNVRVRPVDSGELHVSWSVPERESWNGELLGYVVSWREAEGMGTGRVVIRGMGGETRVAVWGAKGRLAFTVRAFNRAGISPPSHTVFAAANAVALFAPSSVRCEAVSARAVRVRWSPRPASLLLHYDIIYAPILFSQTWSAASRTATAQADGSGGEAVVSGLRAAVNYSLSVRARTNTGTGPLSNLVYCQTKEDVPGVPEAVRAVAASAQAVRVTWAAPPPEVRGGRITHYTLYTRELGKVGGEWAQRVESEDESREVRREVRGLRDGAVYEFWVRASTSAGPGAPSRAVSAAPAQIVSARISSVSTETVAAVGTRVRLACAALGAPPLRRRWAPLPPEHIITDAGDLIIHKLEERWSGNYTCSVRNAAGTDTVRHGVIAVATPSSPVPRLLRADTHRLVVGWEAVRDGGAPLLHYSVQWRLGWGQKGSAEQLAMGGEQAVGADETRCEVGMLECGARYTVTMRAHNAAGASSYSAPLQVRTSGDKALAPPGRQSIWANSSAIRVSLLAWGGRCSVAAWHAAYRPAQQPRTTWTAIHVDGENLEVANLEPATWYEIRILAQSPAGETPALYRAATRSLAGDQLGEPIDLPVEARLSDVEDEAEVRSSGWGRTGLLSALGGGALALLLAATILLASLRRTSGPTPPPTLHNGKSIDPPLDDCDEISPYATFSMSGSDTARGASAARACSLHVRSLPRSPLALAAPPMRHHLLAQPNEYGTCGSIRDTDSESSGSPCAACAAELYRLPAAHLSDTLPAGATTAAESSTEDGSYSSRHLRPRDTRDVRDTRDTHDKRDGRDTQQRRTRRLARTQPPTIRYAGQMASCATARNCT